MWRFCNFLMAALMLTISVFPPETQWNVLVSFAGRPVGANLFHWLFMLTLALYIPLLISAVLLAVMDSVTLLKNKDGRNLFNLVFYFLISLAALYQLNDWVFSRIF